MVDVNGGVATVVLQESHLNVAAAIVANILGSLGIVIVPLTGARECHISIAAVEVGHVN